MFEAQELKIKVEQKIPGSQVEVVDLRNDNNHFRIDVIWEGFEGKSLIEQHRTVNEALSEELKAGLHSISIKTKIKNGN